QQRVPEAVLLLTRDAAHRDGGDDLVAREQLDLRLDARRIVGAAEQADDAARPEALAEHARRAEQAASARRQPLEAGIDRRQDGLGQRAAVVVRRRADELFEEEGVARGALADARDRGGRG